MGRPKNPKSIATEPWEDSKERSNSSERRVEVPLVDGYRCLSQAHDQAERMVDNKKHLKKSELNKIKAECEDDCCHPNEELRNEPSVVQERLVYEHKRMRLEEKTIEFRFRIQNYYGPENYYSFPSSSRSATSSAIPAAATEHSENSKATKEDKTAIPEAATEHSEIRRLPTLANKNSRSSEAATEHSESPKAAKKDKTAIAEAVTKEKTQIPEAATEHSESSKATKEDKTKESRSQYQRKPLPQPKKAAPNTKGSSSQNQRKPLPIPRKRARTASPDPEEVRG